MKGSTKAVGGSPVSGGAQDFTNFLRGGLNTGSFGGGGMPFSQNAIGQTMGMGNAIDQMLGGQAGGDPMTLTNYFRNGNGMANIGNVNSNFQAPNFNNTQFNTPATFNSGYNLQSFSPVNINGPQQIGPTDFNSAFNQVNSVAGYSLDDIKNVMNQQLNQQVLNQGASLAGSGTGFMSSGKALGEALIRQNAPAQLGLALSQIGNDKANQALQLAGINQQGQLANQQAGMGFNNQLLDLGSMRNQFNLNNAGQAAQFAQGAAGINNDAMNQINQLMLQQGLAGNQFNQSNAQFGSQQNLTAQMQNMQNLMQNQQLGNQMQLGLGNLFQGFQGQNLSAQQQMLGQLFNAFNQLNALGTPQAQMVQTPSPFQQVTGAIGNIGQMLQPFFPNGMSNPFGGGGNMPNLGPMPQTGFTPNGFDPRTMPTVQPRY